MSSDLKPQLQVLLVGGRQTPNVIGVLTQKPAIVEFLVSKDAKPALLQNLRETLGGIQDVQLSQHEVILDPFDFHANLQACCALYEQYPDHRIAFNLTGSTKIMALAAYEAAKSGQADAFYVDTANQRILPVVGTLPKTPIRLTIEQYLGAYGRIPLPTFEFQKLSFEQSAAVRAAGILAQHPMEATPLLAAIRQAQGSGRRRVPLPHTTIGLAELLAAERTIDVELAQKVMFIRSNHDWNFFKGGWLEVYTWNEMQVQTDRHGKPLFQDCALSLEIPSGAAKKEIDAIGIYQAQALLCSCKCETKPFQTEYLDELSAVAHLIGGWYCSRIFVTNGLPHANESKWIEFQEQAKQREIVVITGDDLIRVGEILSQEAIKPTYPRV